MMERTRNGATGVSSERVMLAALALAAAALLAVALTAEGAAHPDELEIPELAEIRIPEAERMELENGLVVYVLEDRAFPMIEVRTLTRGGTAFDPASEIGLAALSAQVMRTGGSERHPGDALDLAVESVGTEISISAGERLFSGRLSALTQHFDESLDILADVLRRPVFPEDKIDEAKQQENTHIASRNDDPVGILRRELGKLVFGEDSPYGWHTDYATIAAIERDDLVAAHTRFFHPDRTTVVAWGDVSPGEMRQALERVFGDWPRSGTDLEEPPAVPEGRPAGLYYAEKTDVTQSTVAAGGIGIQQSDPMYPAAKVLEAVLGSGFSSRLFAEIRTRRGLAYATGAFVNAPLSRPGTTVGFVLTQADSTVTTLELLLAEIERIRTEPITEEELALGKDKILNSFVFQFESPGDVVLRSATYELFGYEPDFLLEYQKGVAQVTVEDVMHAAHSLFHPDARQILVVGNDETFTRSLSELMPVTELDISVPDPPVTAAPIPAPTAESLARGQALVAKVVEAHGGMPALRGVEGYTVRGTAKASMQGMDIQVAIEQIFVMPDKQYTSQSVFGQKMVQAIDGRSGWRQGPQGLLDIAEEEVVEMWEDELTDGGLHFLLRAPELELQALDPETIDGVTYDVVHVRDLEGKALRLYLDRESSLIARSSHRGKHPMTRAPADIVETYDDYRGMGGLLLAHRREMLVGGEHFLSLTIDELRVNEETDLALFAKPEGS